jgi:hypothetical protein
VLGLGVVVALAWPSVAHADLVRLASGQVLAVTSVTMDGDMAVLVLRSGGEVRAPRSVIAEIGPDEMPTPDPAPPPAPLAPAPPAAGDSIHVLLGRLAAQFGVPLNLAQAVVEVESNYQPRAVSPKGAMGLMQLMPDLAKEYALVDPFDPEQNLAAGLKHLKGLLDRFPGNVSTALAAYNAGEGAVERYGGIPPYSETRDYVQRVMALARLP